MGKNNENSSALWENLVISILSVNQYTVETTYKLFDSLKSQGLFDPNNLIEWNHETVFLKLSTAGLNRGNFMVNLFTNRLKSLGSFVNEKSIAACEHILQSRNKDEISRYFLQVNGIGPVVLQNYFLLSQLS